MLEKHNVINKKIVCACDAHVDAFLRYIFEKLLLQATKDENKNMKLARKIRILTDDILTPEFSILIPKSKCS